MKNPTPRQVRQLLIAQPALVSEIEATNRREGVEAGVCLLMHRLGATAEAATAGWYRWCNPESRAVGCSYISRNGGKVREYTSLIGNGRISMSNNYPMTKRVSEWIDAQVLAVETAQPYAAKVAGLIA